MNRQRRQADEPNMSDRTLLVSVEDLINMAMGPAETNVVNYKLVQTILHILARQMRVLEQRVEIQIADERASRGSPSLEDIREGREGKQRRLSKESRASSKGRAKEASKEKEKEQRAAEREKDRAGRDKDKGERATSIEREKGDKERQKGEKSVDKEKEKAERAASKEKGKEDKREKEREKAEKPGGKEKDRAGNTAGKDRAGKTAGNDKEREVKLTAKEAEKAAKDQEKYEKMTPREREMEDKMSARGRLRDRPKGKTGSDTSIMISEVDRRKEKVLVVEKGPTTRAGADGRRESIEVVTRSQFNMVESLVADLQRRAGPPPPPALPDNKQLMGQLQRGSASLTDTMQAMQVTARVRAAEQAIGRMGDLLTQLAAAGALPEDLLSQIGEVKYEAPDADAATVISMAMQPKGGPAAAGQKSVAIDPMLQEDDSHLKPSKPGVSARSSLAARPSLAGRGAGTPRASVAASRASVSSSGPGLPGVTHPEMDVALRTLREDLLHQMQAMTAKASSVAQKASATAKGVADKLDIAVLLDKRISALNGVVVDHADQLSGFDAGLTSQMQSFRDQIREIQMELQSGLKQLALVNNNVETAAVMELTERYDGLALELEHTLHAHTTLTTFQRQLGDELKGLVECVEMLREQKADRDEVLDGLRDKADSSRLAGLLTVVEFHVARGELEMRMDVCHDKFRRQENVWMTALKDLMLVTESKAEITQLLSARDHAEQALRELADMQERLAVILGEPKAAMLTRLISRGASCGACLVPALMEPRDSSYGAPPPLPAARPRPPEQPQQLRWQPPQPPDGREHTCHRWVGGSHTLLPGGVTRAHATPPTPNASPTKRYTGYGVDGRLYQLEEDMQPCAECNQYSEKALEEALPELGAGDQPTQEQVVQKLPDGEK